MLQVKSREGDNPAPQGTWDMLVLHGGPPRNTSFPRGAGSAARSGVGRGTGGVDLRWRCGGEWLSGGTRFSGKVLSPLGSICSNERLVAPSVPRAGSSDTAGAGLARRCARTAMQRSAGSTGCQDLLRSHLPNAGGLLTESLPY